MFGHHRRALRDVCSMRQELQVSSSLPAEPYEASRRPAYPQDARVSGNEHERLRPQGAVVASSESFEQVRAMCQDNGVRCSPGETGYVAGRGFLSELFGLGSAQPTRQEIRKLNPRFYCGPSFRTILARVATERVCILSMIRVR